MAISPDILNESELAKAKILNSNSLDEDYKKSLLNLINVTTLATNGITTDEKIQKMTEAIHMLAISQVSFITQVEESVVKSIENVSIQHCSNCKAMKHAEVIEEKEAQEKLLEDWRKANKLPHPAVKDKKNIKDEIINLLFTAIQQPFMWIAVAILGLSPHSANILTALKNLFN